MKKIKFTKEQVELMENWMIGTIEDMPTITSDFGFMDSPEFDKIDLSREEIINRLKLWFKKLGCNKELQNEVEVKR